MKIAYPKYALLTIMLSISILFAACSVTKHTAQQNSASQFTISPKAININQIFTIKVPGVHPSSLSIRDPTGIWHVVHDSREKVFILPKDEYVKARKIDISPTKLMGINWTDGKKTEGLVFRLPGEYLIYTHISWLKKMAKNSYSIARYFNATLESPRWRLGLNLNP